MAYATGTGGTSAKDAAVAYARRKAKGHDVQASRRGRRLNRKKRRRIAA